MSCRYNVIYGFCKFGADSSFSHPIIIEPNTDITNDVQILKESLEHVLNSLKIKEREIKRLDEIIQHQEQNPQHKKENICDICSYKAMSENTMKEHTQREHTQEELRKSSLCDTL